MMVPDGLEPTRDLVTEKPELWREIPIYDDMSAESKKAALRLNAHGSMLYFGKIILGYNRLANFHRYLCRELERWSLRLVMEVPRDHFKTTIASVIAPMWWALPYLPRDEDLMLALGYSEKWIQWMHRAHYSSTRTLIASEIIGNARKIGSTISGHYESNAIFRYIFPEILPKDTARWNQDSMTHTRLDGVFHGEGTYDFIGVKGALQSRHYIRQVLDDLVGEKAINSDLVMEATIDWVRKLPGAFDSDPKNPDALADQLFIGNRWSHRDVGTWLRKNVPNLQFITHSADGGCCDMHPYGECIFPEEFTLEKLAEFKAIYGSYNYAAQMRNKPTAPEAVRFKTDWLRTYSVDVWQEPKPESNIVNWNQLTTKHQQKFTGTTDDYAESQGATPQRLKKAFKHVTKPGETIEDIRGAELDRIALMDPNHSGEGGRSRNAILVIGVWNRPPTPRRVYLLDAWAKACGHEEWIEAALGTKPGHRGMVLKWKCHYLFLESEVAGQQGWKFYIRELIKRMGMEQTFSLRPLKTDRSENAKHKRIIGMESIYENGFFWVPNVGCGIWREEYEEYPNGAYMDLLDLTGYLPQTWSAGSRGSARDFMAEEIKKRNAMLSSIGPAGY